MNSKPMSDGKRMALIAVGAAVVAGIYLAVNSKPAAASPPGSATNFLAPITDPAAVKQYQTLLAWALANTANVPGLTAASYGSNDVDGNPANPKWVAVLSTFQKDANAVAGGFQNVPGGFPAKLRTDGVLDYATSIVIQNT
jgi:hypothetical protein